MGFSSHSTKVNKELWFDALFEFYSELNSLSNSFSLKENFEEEFNPTETSSLLFSNSVLADTTEKEKIEDSLFISDTSTTILDTTTTILDTVVVDSLALDSTARLAQFKYQREDKPYISFYTGKQSKFFLQNLQKKRTITIDSTGKYVEITERIGDKDVKLPIRITLIDYLNLKLATREQELWDELGYKYELKESDRDLGKLIKDFTDFEIPLPSVGVLSIFGAPKISLRISGAVDIHGAWRNETTEGITASRLGNTRNEPDFRQQVQINVNGTIGDKLQINADWNTERTFEYENQLKLKYTGYEDEIVQSVEAGNVSLQTSSLVGGGEALFGVKASFKMGPFSLTTIASQKKGEVKEKSITSGATTQPFVFSAHNYSKGHYFLDEVYADTSADLNLFNKYFGNATPEIIQRYRIKDIEVWKSVNLILKDPNERNVNAFIDLPIRSESEVYPDSFSTDNVQEVPGSIAKGRFIRLTQDVDYILHPETGFITFKTTPQDIDMIAVAYRVENTLTGPEDDQFYGNFLSQAGSDTSQRLVLKLIKPSTLQPKYKKAWNLVLKNIYAIGGKNIKKTDFKFYVKRVIVGQDSIVQIGSVQLNNAFGLDYLDKSDGPYPDGEFDFKPGTTIFPESGEIIFPVLQPFGRNLPKSLPGYDTLRFDAMYDTTEIYAQQNIKNLWVMTGIYSGEASATYSLGFNIVENSVKVSLNGRELTAGADYSVDYNIGQLTIRNDAALAPGANLKISYEENDLFQLASKTLFGARGIYDFSRDTKLGFTALTLSQQTLSDKVRIGEEPLSNSIYGIDFSTQSDLPFLTKAIDYISSTRDMSNFTLRGDFAYMSPDPNTKKSTVASDAGQSIAYIDDFEGAKRIIPVGIGYTTWKDLSVPQKTGIAAIDTLSNNLLKMDFKGKSFWFNVLPSNVNVNSIWPDKKVARGDEQVTVLDYVFLPDTPGTFNYFPKLSNPQNMWGGMMKILSSTASDLVKENIEFIEFWANIQDAPPNAKIYLDIGKISEDVIPDNKLDTEDKNFNDLIDEGEDNGLDGLTDDQERTTYGSTAGDPSGDNFNLVLSGQYNKYNYFNVNGTQGNAALTDVGRFPDTEDLNRNGSLDQVNSFYRYEIPLDTLALNNPYIAGGGNNYGWYLYRIPLKDFKEEFGNPSFSVVEFIRLFVAGTADELHIRMTEFNLVGSQWQRENLQDSLLSVSVVNIEDNPEYSSPSGVQRERDRTRPDQDILRNEQSLNLIVRELPDGESRQAVKYLYRPLDVFNYKEMKLFVHGQTNDSLGSLSYFVDENNYSADFFFRFGSDSNNFYEYRQPIKSDWHEISILFSTITAIKQTRDSANMIFRIPVEGKPGHYYAVKGNPSLTGIKFLSVGVYNTNNPNLIGTISGDVWVNELRVIGADDTPGWAYSVSSSIKFADLMTVNVNYAQTDPYFHRLSERFGSRIESRNWSLSTDLDVIKLMPFNMPGSSLRVNYSHSENIGKPLFLPGTDIKVSEAKELLREKLSDSLSTDEATRVADQLETDAQTMNVSDTWSLSQIKLRIPVNYWLIEDTFNSLTFGFNYNTSFSRNPTTLSSTNWIWNANVNYNIAISPEYNFYPAEIPLLGSLITIFTDYRNAKFYYTPQTFSWNINAKRSRSINAIRPIGNTVSEPVISRDFTATRGLSFSWKMTENAFLNVTTAYSFDIGSSLSYLEVDEFQNQRPSSRIWKEILTGESFGKDVSYQQTVDVKTSPRIPTIWDLNRFFTLTAGYNVRYQWQSDLRQASLGRGAGSVNKSTLGITLRLKTLTAPLFAEDETPKTPVIEQPKRGRERNFEEEKNGEQKREEEIISDTSKTLIDNDTTDIVVQKPSALLNLLMTLKSVSKFLFFDYETINLSFSNDNNLSSSGIYGEGSGLYNFWGIKTNIDNGPSRLFMLGLTKDAGPRARNGNLSDNYSQRNSLDMRTSRPLWEGAKIDLNWKVGWSVNKSTSLQSDSLGNISITNITSTGTINRSFLTLPPTFIFSFFKSGIKTVNELYDPSAKNLSEAFLQGFESMPWLSKLGFLKDVAKYIPRPNWRLSWSGLEKYSIFQSFAKSASLDHSYTSEYTEGWKIDPDGKQVIQTQKISYAFSPLIGLNLTFTTLWDGNLGGNIKYSVRNNYDLGLTTKNITESFSRDIGVSLNYSKSGFEIPLFGVSLKNDIEFSFSYTNTKNSTVIFDMEKFTEDGTPQDGTTRTSLEPRVKYVISQKVTLSLFYKRSSIAPEGAARISPSTTNEAGLDVRITIQ